MVKSTAVASRGRRYATKPTLDIARLNQNEFRTEVVIAVIAQKADILNLRGSVSISTKIIAKAQIVKAIKGAKPNRISTGRSFRLLGI